MFCPLEAKGNNPIPGPLKGIQYSCLYTSTMKSQSMIEHITFLENYPEWSDTESPPEYPSILYLETQFSRDRIEDK